MQGVQENCFPTGSRRTMCSMQTIIKSSPLDISHECVSMQQSCSAHTLCATCLQAADVDAPQTAQ
eukprot:COSAG02_NODE_7080_length_3194_cov_3.346189_5_plen_65_part_00